MSATLSAAGLISVLYRLRNTVMLRLNEVKLPLDHAAGDIEAAILARLGIPETMLVSYTVFKRSYDARKKSAIVLIYALDVVTTDDTAILQRMHSHVGVTPDTDYHFVAHASGTVKTRPVVIGTGPCGLF